MYLMMLPFPVENSATQSFIHQSGGAKPCYILVIVKSIASVCTVQTRLKSPVEGKGTFS